MAGAHIEGVVTVLLVIVGVVSFALSAKTFIDTRREHFDDYIRRKRS